MWCVYTHDPHIDPNPTPVAADPSQNPKLTSADARLDAAVVPALLGAPAAALRTQSSAERHAQLAALAGRRVVASLYAGVGPGAGAHIAGVRLLNDADALPR